MRKVRLREPEAHILTRRSGSWPVSYRLHLPLTRTEAPVPKRDSLPRERSTQEESSAASDLNTALGAHASIASRFLATPGFPQPLGIPVGPGVPPGIVDQLDRMWSFRLSPMVPSPVAELSPTPVLLASLAYDLNPRWQLPKTPNLTFHFSVP